MTTHAMMVQANSQCGGQGFDPPLLHHLFSMIYSRRHWRLFWSTGQYLDIFPRAERDRFNGHALGIINRPHITHRPRTSEYPRSCAIVKASHPASAKRVPNVALRSFHISRSIPTSRQVPSLCKSLETSSQFLHTFLQKFLDLLQHPE